MGNRVVMRRRPRGAPGRTLANRNKRPRPIQHSDIGGLPDRCRQPVSSTSRVRASATEVQCENTDKSIPHKAARPKGRLCEQAPALGQVGQGRKSGATRTAYLSVAHIYRGCPGRPPRGRSMRDRRSGPSRLLRCSRPKRRKIPKRRFPRSTRSAFPCRGVCTS